MNLEFDFDTPQDYVPKEGDQGTAIIYTDKYPAGVRREAKITMVIGRIMFVGYRNNPGETRWKIVLVNTSDFTPTHL